MFRKLLPERPKSSATPANGADEPPSPAVKPATTNTNGNGNGKAKITTVFGPGSSLVGKLFVPGGTRIDGAFEGELEIDGPLIIGEQAMIMADIRASAVTVAGTVKGNVTAERVDILKSGRIYGDLITYGFSTEEGGFLRGQVYMPDGTEEINPLDVAPAAPNGTLNGTVNPATP